MGSVKDTGKDATAEKDEQSDGLKGVELTSTDRMERMERRGADTIGEIVLRVSSLYVPQGNKMMFVNLENDDQFSIQLGSFEEALTKKLKSMIAVGSVLKFRLLRMIPKTSSLNRAAAKYALKFTQNSSAHVVIQAEEAQPKAIDSFDECKDGDRRLSGMFVVLDKPTNGYQHGGKSGIKFTVGDDAKNGASVFVGMENENFVESVGPGKYLSYSEASASYQGDELWLSFEIIKHLNSVEKKPNLQSVDPTDYSSPKRRKVVHEAATNEDRCGEWK